MLCRKRCKHLQRTVSEHHYLHGAANLPIYCASMTLLTTSQCVNSLFDPDLESSMICSRVLFSVAQNAVFIVDMNSLVGIVGKFSVITWAHGSGAAAIAAGLL